MKEQITPNEGVNEAFKRIVQETRDGKISSFWILTKFTPGYIQKLAPPATGTFSVFGENRELIGLISQATAKICRELSQEDRASVLYMLTAAVLGTTAPLSINVQQKPL